MGLIVWTFLSSQGNGSEYMKAASIGLLGAVIGSIVSVRVMMIFTKKFFGYDKEKEALQKLAKSDGYREITEGSTVERVLNALLEGGKNGVQIGFDIIPGVVVICSLVMILTYKGSVDPQTGNMVYTGAAYEGVALIPKVGAFLSPVLNTLFGFTSNEAIAFPLTALGSVGAALGMVPKLLTDGSITANDIAVFTALGMCWSGYLSTHVGMMDALGVRKLAPKAILSHTLGGLAAGISAHFLFFTIRIIKKL